MDLRETIDLYRTFMYPENVYNITNRIMYHTSHRAAVKRGKKKRGKSGRR